MKQFLAITKVDAEQRMVYGYASTEAVDSQGEVVSKAAIEGAWDDYMKFANVREMHGNSAAGIVKEHSFDDKGVFIGAKIVDDQAWAKVVEGVYKGFSIGGKKLKDGFDAVTKTITKMKLTEISLVDRPANPDALIEVFKFDGDVDAVEIDLSNAETLAKMLSTPQIQAAIAAQVADGIAKAAKAKDNEIAYADPENEKYPIDTVKHIKAAWSYINMPKNQKGYTDAEVDAIKAKIIAAWKKEIDKDGPPSADDTDKYENVSDLRKALHSLTYKGEDIKKGMYAVGSFADLLTQLSWLQQDAAWEAAYENDSSSLPAQLATLVQQAGAVMLAMAQEEIGELIASMKGPDGTPIVTALDDTFEIITTVIANSEYAADLKKFSGAMDIIKAGARNSKEDQEKLQAAHDALGELGAKCKDSKEDETGKHDHHGDIEKMSGELGTLRKSFAAQTSELGTLKASYDALQKRFNKTPADPKAIINAHVVVEKSADINPLIAATFEVEPVLKQDGTVDQSATDIKKIFAGGGQPFGQKP